MDENLKDQEVLLVKDDVGEKLNVVAGISDDGTLKKVSPIKENETQFLKFDKHSNPLENFLSNYLRQQKKPSHSGFFRAAVENITSVSKLLEDLLKHPDQNKALIDSAKVDIDNLIIAPQEKREYTPFDESRIDWSAFEKIGVNKEDLEKSKSLNDMLNYRKSPHLLPITISVDDITLRTDARLSVVETADGRLVPKIHAIRKEPQLDMPFYGNTFTAEDKENLSKNGNLGRVIDLNIKGVNEKVPAFVSIDKQTNQIVAYSTKNVRIPNEIKGVKLNDEQKKALAEGKSVAVDGMTSKIGKKFNANIQVNADKKGIEFKFGETPKQSYSQEQASTYEKVLRVPNKLLGREISSEEQSKLKEGQTVYMTGLIDKKGEPFNAYVKPNFEKNKFDFLKWNPDKSNVKEITPDNNSKTQVSVNSEGKTNEATKDIKESLKQEQSQPNEQQQRKSRGIKM